MKDRVSLNPGRVLVTPENGGAAFYATLTRADNPKQEGDPLGKNTLLKDATAALYGLDETAVPDDVLSMIKPLLDTAQSTANGRARISTGTYIGTGTTGISNKKSLTFDFPVQLFILHDGSAPVSSGFYGSYPNLYCLFIPRNENGTDIMMYYGDATSNKYYCMFQFENNRVMWYAHDMRGEKTPGADYQFNTSGKTYYYIAIG